MVNVKLILSFLIYFTIISGVIAQSLETINVSKNWHFAPDKKNVGVNQQWYSNNFDVGHYRYRKTIRRSGFSITGRFCMVFPLVRCINNGRLF